jgi:hypothetical protein
MLSQAKSRISFIFLFFYYFPDVPQAPLQHYQHKSGETNGSLHGFIQNQSGQNPVPVEHTVDITIANTISMASVSAYLEGMY